MSRIAFKRITPGESRIYQDGDCIGDLYCLDDVLHPGQRVYVAHLDEDIRGPVRIRDRDSIRDVVQQRVDSHPLWG